MSPLHPKSVMTDNNMKMPVIGIGTWQGKNEEMEAVIDEALSAGYRHIDTAYSYGNEAGIGNSLKKSFNSGKLKREDVFVVTKCSQSYFFPETIEKSLDESLEALQLDYVDLFLAHFPLAFKFKEGGQYLQKWTVYKNSDFIANWKEFEKMVDKGKTKHIGVSNFNISQIQRILDVCRIKPAVNQVELYVYLQQPELVKFCKDNGITVVAYCPLGSPTLKALTVALNKDVNQDMFHSPMEDPVVGEIAKKHGKTSAQVLLRFLLQLGVAVIPKSSNPDRMKQNLNIFDFDLTKEDMKKLISLDKGEKGRQATGRDGGCLSELVDHPEYPFPKW